MRLNDPYRLLILTMMCTYALIPRIHGWIRAARRFILDRKSPLCNQLPNIYNRRIAMFTLKDMSEYREDIKPCDLDNKSRMRRRC